MQEMQLLLVAPWVVEAATGSARKNLDVDALLMVTEKRSEVQLLALVTSLVCAAQAVTPPLGELLPEAALLEKVDSPAPLAPPTLVLSRKASSCCRHLEALAA